MSQITNNPYTFILNNNYNINCNISKNTKCGPDPDPETGMVDLSYYAQNWIPNYETVTEIPTCNLKYLLQEQGTGLKASNIAGFLSGMKKLSVFPNKLRIDTSNCTDWEDAFFDLNSYGYDKLGIRDTIFPIPENLYKLLSETSEINNFYDKMVLFNIESSYGMFSNNLKLTKLSLSLEFINKYLFLYSNKLTNMMETYDQNSNMVIIPCFSKVAENLRAVCSGCTSLISIPDIPETAKNMNESFFQCKTIERAPDIPENVTNLKSCFSGCVNLKGTICIYADNVTNVTDLVSDDNYHKIIYCHQGTQTETNLKNSIKSYWNAEIKSFKTVNSISDIVSNLNKSDDLEIATEWTVDGGGIDTYHITDWSNGFKDFKSLQKLPDRWYNMTKAENCSSLFEECNSLEDASSMVYGNHITNMDRMHYKNRSLIKIPEVIPSSVVTMNSTYQYTDSLAMVPHLPLDGSLKEMNYTFADNMSISYLSDPYFNMLMEDNDVSGYLIPSSVTSMIGTFSNTPWIRGTLLILSENIETFENCFTETDGLEVFIIKGSKTEESWYRDGMDSIKGIYTSFLN